MNTKDQRKAAFREAAAILALEGMVEPEGDAQLCHEVIDSKPSFDEAVAKVIEQSARESGRTETSAQEVTDEPLAEEPFVSEEEWLQAILEGTKRMSEDEDFRLQTCCRTVYTVEQLAPEK